MSIRWRLLFVLGLLLIAFFASLWALRQAEREQVEKILDDTRREGREQLARWVDIAGLPLRHFTLDFARWEQTAAFLAHPDPDWAKANLEGSLQSYDLQAVWVLRCDGSIASSARRDRTLALPELPTAANLVTAANHQGRLTFFARSPAGLWQVHGSTIAPADDTHAPTGWLIAARLWDADELDRLGHLSESTVTLAAGEPAEADDRVVTLARPLRDWAGRPLETLHLAKPAPVLAGLLRWDGYVANLFVAFGLLLLVAMYLSVRLWVLGPLDRIGQSLARQDPGAIAPLLRHQDEFTRVARLVETSFADRAALEREVAERRDAEAALVRTKDNLRHSIEVRARLARDLHDTVIQSIYAAGLGLESVRAQLSTDPFGAESRIRHCMTSLNETIRHIRSFITDLEPDAPPHRQPLADAVRALAATMQSLWPVEIVVQLDDEAAAHLSAAHELHALQIVRECISNALRHGGASRVDVLLRQTRAHVVLEVRDNGRGFDPAQRTGTGRGLVNLAARAKEMGAELQLEAAEGQGACISLRFPHPAA